MACHGCNSCSPDRMKIAIARNAAFILARYFTSEKSQEIVNCVLDYSETPSDASLLRLYDLLQGNQNATSCPSASSGSPSES